MPLVVSMLRWRTRPGLGPGLPVSRFSAHGPVVGSGVRERARARPARPRCGGVRAVCVRLRTGSVLAAHVGNMSASLACGTAVCMLPSGGGPAQG